jgi:ubiquinol-cytochrome c reductase subunit 6
LRLISKQLTCHLKQEFTIFPCALTSMGFFDFISDLYTTIGDHEAHAEAPSGENDPKDQSRGKSTTSEQTGAPSVRGGISSQSPAARSDEASSEEAEVNKADARGGGESEDPGHRPSKVGKDEDSAEEDGDGDGGDKEEEEDEGEGEAEEEEEEEPQDPKLKLEEGKIAINSRQLSALQSKDRSADP